MKLLFDFPGGWYFFYVGTSILLVVLMLLIVVFEALILYGFQYGSLRRSLHASVAMNIFSAFLGFIAANFIERSRAEAPGYYGDIDEVVAWFFFADSLQWPGLLPATALFLLISWVISVASEGGFLMLLGRGRPNRPLWRMALVANLVSYGLLMGPYIWLTVMPGSRDGLVAVLTTLVSWPVFLLFSPTARGLFFIGLLGALMLGGFFGWRLARRRARV